MFIYIYIQMCHYTYTSHDMMICTCAHYSYPLHHTYYHIITT